MLRLFGLVAATFLLTALAYSQTWNLVWSDEFDTNGAVDASKWHHQTQLLFPGCCWANGELQHYTDRLDNSSVNNGVLSIEAKKENFTDQGVQKGYTSARLNSKFAFQYGRVVVRAKLPTGGGTWPAIWMLGKNIDEDGGYWDDQGFGTTAWPACGEIDIMEHWGWNQNYVSSAMHTPSSFGGTVNVGGQVIPTVSSAFHDYEMIWTADSIWFAVDGVHHYTYNPAVKDASTWPFDAEQYLLLNLAVEGNVDPSWTSKELEIDYVRVYDSAGPEVTFRVDVSDLTLAPTDVVYWNSDQNGWCGNCAPMTDLGNGIWEIIVAQGYAPGPWEYKFTINEWAIQENLDPVADANCTVTDAGFTNRIVNVGFVNLDAGTFCWESCDPTCSNSSGSSAPMVPAPDPTIPATDVISMFSGVYTNVPVDTWQTPWSSATLLDTVISGNATKKYSSLDFVGIETVSNQIDISSMDMFHVDIWSPNLSTFRVKLVDFGPDGGFQGGDDSEHEVVVTAPGIGQWVSLAIPMSDFVNLTGRSNFAQLIFSGIPVGSGIVYIDNIYFSQTGGTSSGNGPMVPAPTPTEATSDVISMFSDVYTDVPVDTWQTSWSQGSVLDTTIIGDATKKYENLNFVGIETVANQIDVSGMSTFHFDAWTPNMTELRVKLVDFGPDGVFQGGDDSEHEITFSNPSQFQWIEYDIPLDDFVGLNNLNNIAQLIFAAQPAGTGALYLDNIYFSGTPNANVPIVAAPIPTEASSDVISMYSDVYANVPVDTWETPWSAGDLVDTTIAGNPTKKYSILDFVGIETVNDQIDISDMDYFHFDAWTPNMTQLRVKLVDFGPNGTYDAGGLDDSEHEISFENPMQGGWVEFDIPIADFASLSNLTNISQLIFSGQPAGAGIVYIDNVYFSKVSEPSVAIKAFLQGPFDSGSSLMNDDLRSQGLIPSTDPYPALGFTYSGAGWNDSFDPTVLSTTGNNAIVDWVVVEMVPDAAEPGNTATAYSRPALLQRDGDIVNLDGSSPVDLNMPSGKYFAAVRHRNHLGVIETTGADYGGTSIIVDFTSSGGATVGTDALYQSTGRALWAGDVNFNEQLKYVGSSNDRDIILVEIGGSVPTNTVVGYEQSDINLDGVVKYTGAANDRDIILQNIGGSVPTNVRDQIGF